MGLFRDTFTTTSDLAISREKQNPTSIELAIMAIGTAIDFAQCLSRRSDLKAPRIAFDTWRGFANDVNLRDLSVSNPLPEIETNDLFYHVHGIGRILSLWAAGAIGERPDESEFIGLKEILEWSASGAVFAQKWRYTSIESGREMNAWQFLDYYLNDEPEQLDNAIDRATIEHLSFDLFDNQPYKAAV